jgi:hypothetical protein
MSLYYSVVQVADFFNNIVINRMDKDRNPIGTYTVRAVVGEKTAVYSDLRHGNPPTFPNKMPFIVIEPSTGGLEYDKQRERGMHENIIFNMPGGGSVEQYRPQPVTMTFKLTIFTRLAEDMEQIIQNKFYWMRPYAFVRMPVPGVDESASEQERFVNLKMVWDGSTQPEHVFGTDKIQYFASTATVKVHTWNFMFKDFDYGPIIRIYTEFSAYLKDQTKQEPANTLISWGISGDTVSGMQSSLADVLVSGNVVDTSIAGSGEPTYEPSPGYYVINAGKLMVSGEATIEDLLNNYR